MRHRNSSAESAGKAAPAQEGIATIRSKPLHIYDNITRRLLQLGVTLALTTFVGLIVRYAVKEFDPSVSTITVTTSRVDNRDIASLSVSKNFLERILEFVAESISIVAVIIPLGFPLCTLTNRYFARIRAGSRRLDISSSAVLAMIPKYLIIGDSLACHLPSGGGPGQGQARLRPLVRDTMFHLIRAHMKPKLVVEDSYEEARRLGIKIGLIRRDHHKLAVIKSVDLLKNITDSRGDIKQGKVRYLLSRMKIMSQSTPADKSLLVYLIKHCEPQPNENLAYLGYSFTDPEAMRLADCALTFQDCDDEDVKRSAQVLLKSDSGSFTDIYLFLVVCLITSNITQSYALYQISASVSCCIYRFLCITVFQEQLLSHSQFALLVFLQQVFAILALMTKWLSSLPQAQMRSPVAEMSHEATDETLTADLSGGGSGSQHRGARHHRPAAGHLRQQTHTRSSASLSGVQLERLGGDLSGHQHHLHQSAGALAGKGEDDTLGSSSSLTGGSEASAGGGYAPAGSGPDNQAHRAGPPERMSRGQDTTTSSLSRRSTDDTPQRRRRARRDEEPVHLSGADLDQAVINSKIATNYRQTFHNSALVDDVTYRLAKLHIAYQTLVMIIIIIFGNAMFQLNMANNRQHQTLALNSLVMNNLFNLANCFNQFGEFNLRAGFRNHPFFLCVLLFAVALQVCLTELNAFGLENLNPSQWFVCFVFASMSALIAPLTGQQRSQRQAPGGSGDAPAAHKGAGGGQHQHQHRHQHQHGRESAAVTPSKQYHDNYM